MKRINCFLGLIKEFGLFFGSKLLFSRLLSKTKYQKTIFDRLKKEVSSIVLRYKNDDFSSGHAVKNKFLWTSWWQGETLAPEVVRLCLDSMRKNIVGEYQLIVIDKNNWKNYINFSETIMEKIRHGKITLTHLSDLIRAKVIRKYGGVWIDATVFVTRQYHIDNFFKHSLFTIRYSENQSHVINGRWAGFFIGSNSIGSKLFCFLDDCFELYWKKHDRMIAYLLIDYFIAIAIDQFDDVKNMYYQLQISNTGLFDLMSKLKDEWNGDSEKVFRENVFLKLSYKKEFDCDNLCYSSAFSQSVYNYLYDYIYSR